MGVDVVLYLCMYFNFVLASMFSGVKYIPPANESFMIDILFQFKAIIDPSG